MKCLLIFLAFIIFSLPCYADKCTTNLVNGDQNCISDADKNVSYIIPSQATLVSEKKKQDEIDQQYAFQKQQKELNDQALQELITNQIANDKTLSVQQVKITKSLNAIQIQSK